MPITSPIIGAGTPGSVVNTYSSRAAISIENGSIEPSHQSLDTQDDPIKYIAFEALTVQANVPKPSFQSLVIRTPENYEHWSSVEVVAGDSFLILLDIISSALSSDTLSEYGYEEINARLIVNGDNVVIDSFDYQQPPDRLGSILNIKLTEPDIDLVPLGGDITFQIVLTIDGEEVTHTLMENGKLTGRSYSMQYVGNENGGPVDEVRFSAMDVLADRFTLAPRRPVVMYDPQRVSYAQVQDNPRDSIKDENGRNIMPIVEPVKGLTMMQILQRAYTSLGGHRFTSALDTPFLAGGSSWVHLLSSPEVDQQGCGFDNVVTNIKNYKARRADWGVEGSWQDGASPFVDMWGPNYFEHNNILFIINSNRTLPYGYTPYLVALSKHKSLQEDVVVKPDTNAVLLTYQFDASEDDATLLSTTENLPVEVDVSGVFGEEGYVKTITRRTIRKWYYSDDPLNYIDSKDETVVVETRAAVHWVDDERNTIKFTSEAVSSRDTIVNRYDNFALKVGHTRQFEAMTFKVGQPFAFLQTILEETCNISWIEDPVNPGQKIQAYARTVTNAKLATDTVTEDIQDVDGSEITVTRWVPVILIEGGNAMYNDYQHFPGLATWKTKTEYLRPVRANQYDVHVVEYNHLTNSVSRSIVEPTVGNSAADPFEVRSRTILLRDEESEAEIGPRVPVSVNAYELPRDQALELGHEALHRLKNPLLKMPLNLVSVDFAIQKGSVIRGQKGNGSTPTTPGRVGNTADYFVTGFGITGTNLGRDGHRISMSAEGIELLAQ